MVLEEFTDFIMESGLVNDILNAREIPIFFGQSLILHVNEVDSDKHMHAGYTEFLEAFARACDEASIYKPPRYSDNGELIDDDDDDVSLPSEEERRSLPLHVKIENAIPYLFHNCVTLAFSENYSHPKMHKKFGLYILPNGKFF